MTFGEWIALVAALGGGAGISEIVRRVRGPEPKARDSTAPAPCVSREELNAIRRQVDELRTALEDVEDRARDRLDTKVAELVEKMHSLALKLEHVLASYHVIDDVRPSRRGSRG
jgi:signal transduction histidine kinase